MSGRPVIELPDELVEAVAERVAEKLREERPEPPRSPWMTVREAAEYLRWPVQRIYKQAPGMPHRKHGQRLLFHRDELDRWLDSFREGRTA